MSPVRGRPPGMIRDALLHRLPQLAPACANDLARALQIPLPTARYTLSRMAAAGEVAVVSAAPAQRAAGRRRAVYAPALAASGSGGGSAGAAAAWPSIGVVILDGDGEG